MSTKWSMKCTVHTYVSLYWDGAHVLTMDNDGHYMEEIIEKIEKRTGLRFNEIPIQGSRQDFSGLRYLNGGFKKPDQIFASQLYTRRTT